MLGNLRASRYKADLHSWRRRIPGVVLKGQGECLHTLSGTAENAGAVYRACWGRAPRLSATGVFICLTRWDASGSVVQGVIESTIYRKQGLLELSLLAGLFGAQLF